MFCELFGYSKQAYYKQCQQHRLTEVHATQAEEMVLDIRRKMPRIGTRKLHHLLKDQLEQQQVKLGRDGLFTLLRKEGLLVNKLKSTQLLPTPNTGCTSIPISPKGWYWYARNSCG